MNDMQCIFWMLVWAVFWGRIAYAIGKPKGEGPTACIGGVLLGPIGVLMALAPRAIGSLVRFAGR
ncbi:MAG: hypothetical protein ABFD54_12830 [Armatimonadota bacterium]|nr:hypothetical protein [bacterium]